MSLAQFESNLAAANTAFDTAFQAFFKEQLAGVASQFTQVLNTDARDTKMVLADHLSKWRVWSGDKQFREGRAYSQTISIEAFERSIQVDRMELAYDRSGAVGGMLANFVQSAAEQFLDEQIFAEYASNATCYDGVALFSTSHPYGADGAAWSNKTTSALSESTLRAGINAMRAFRRENGDYLGINPTHLLVHSDQEFLATELVGAIRPVGVTATGVWPATGSAVASVGIDNVLSGKITVISSPRLSDTADWALMDLSKPGLRPFVALMGREPEGIYLDAMDSDPRFHKDKFEYSIEADAGFGPGIPHLIYGRRGG